MSLLISDEIIQASRMSEKELLQELILLLFQQNKLSQGKASKLLGINQIDFQKLLSSRNICIHYDVEEFHQDIQSLEARGWR